MTTTNFPQPPAELPDFVQHAMIDWAKDDGGADIEYCCVLDERLIPYEADLTAYGMAVYQYYESRRGDELGQYAYKYNISDNLELAKHLMELEQRLDNLRQDYQKLYDSHMQHDHAPVKRRWSWDAD